MFTESGKRPQEYLFLAAVILLAMFLIYVYVCEHKVSIDDGGIWTSALRNAGVSRENIKDITHDDSGWYLKRKSLCVMYGGDFDGRCRRYEGHCAGDFTFGDEKQQAQAIQTSIENNGEHPKCPLVYPGAN